jgi:hypothetical protein
MNASPNKTFSEALRLKFKITAKKITAERNLGNRLHDKEFRSYKKGRYNYIFINSFKKSTNFNIYHVFDIFVCKTNTLLLPMLGLQPTISASSSM